MPITGDSCAKECHEAESSSDDEDSDDDGDDDDIVPISKVALSSSQASALMNVQGNALPFLFSNSFQGIPEFISGTGASLYPSPFEHDSQQSCGQQ